MRTAKRDPARFDYEVMARTMVTAGVAGLGAAAKAGMPTWAQGAAFLAGMAVAVVYDWVAFGVKTLPTD